MTKASACKSAFIRLCSARRSFHLRNGCRIIVITPLLVALSAEGLPADFENSAKAI